MTIAVAAKWMQTAARRSTVGAELALVERAAGDAERAPRRRRAGSASDRRAGRRALADDERDAGEADADADLLQRRSRSCSQRETITAVSSGCSARISAVTPAESPQRCA